MRRLEISCNKREVTLHVADLAHLLPGVLIYICSKRLQSGCKVLFWQGSIAGWRGTNVNAMSQTPNQKPWGSSVLASKMRWALKDFNSQPGNLGMGKGRNAACVAAVVWDLHRSSP